MAQTTIVVPSPSYPTIKAGIAAAYWRGGATVLVLPGVYQEGTIGYSADPSRPIRLMSVRGPSETIIQGNNPNSPGVHVSGNGFEIAGFTIRHSTSIGLHLFASGATVRDCVFYRNRAAGVFIRDWGSTGSAARIENCAFIENTGGDGAGITMYSAPAANRSRLLLSRCRFVGNVGAHSGGIVVWSSQNADVTIDGCEFTRNGSQSGLSSAVRASDSLRLVNCRIYDNLGPTGSAVMFGGDAANLIVSNCTIVNNQGIGLEVQVWNTARPPTADLYNTVLWGNAGAFRFVGTPRFTVTHCDVQGGYPGLGNIAVDPQLANPASGNLRLLPTSPCRDTGLSSAPGLPPLDFEGDSRVIGRAVDIGADEFDPRARLLWGDRGQLSLSTGGSATFRLLGGSRQVFVLLPSLSGTEPGFDFPRGPHVPLNLDAATSFLLANVPGFIGVCDTAGFGQTTVRFPVLPAFLEGLDLSFAAVLLRGERPKSASNAERLRLVR